MSFCVVALDDDCARWACQRELDDGSFETIPGFKTAESAHEACGRFNEDLAKEEEALQKAYSQGINDVGSKLIG